MPIFRLSQVYISTGDRVHVMAMRWGDNHKNFQDGTGHFPIIPGDVGGFMGLLLGGSVLTVFELIDLFVFNFAKKLVARRDEEERERERMERILRRARQAEDQDESDTSRPLSAISDTGGKLGFHAIQPAKYGMPNDAVLVWTRHAKLGLWVI